MPVDSDMGGFPCQKNAFTEFSPQTVAPNSPTPNRLRLYEKTDGGIYVKNSAGLEKLVIASSYDSLVGSMSGLVHRWKFAEVSGNFLDPIGGLTLTASGAFTYSQSAQVGGAVLFGAAAKGVSSGLGSLPVSSASRTFVTVFKPTATGKQTILSYGTSGSTRQWNSMFINEGATGTGAFDVWADDIAFASSGSDSFAWHFMAATVSGQQGVLYIDGATSLRTFGATLSTGSSGNFSIGQDSTNANQSSCYLDDIAVFNRALSLAELSTLYTSFLTG